MYAAYLSMYEFKSYATYMIYMRREYAKNEIHKLKLNVLNKPKIGSDLSKRYQACNK